MMVRNYRNGMLYKKPKRLMKFYVVLLMINFYTNNKQSQILDYLEENLLDQDYWEKKLSHSILQVLGMTYYAVYQKVSMLSEIDIEND